MEPLDYRERRYLSAVEAARFLGVSVRLVHQMVSEGLLPVQIAASGQQRFALRALERVRRKYTGRNGTASSPRLDCYTFSLNHTVQRIYVRNAQSMRELPDASVHLMVTSPPYFNAKMYASEPIEGDLGNIHNLSDWLDAIAIVWREVFRVLQPGTTLEGFFEACVILEAMERCPDALDVWFQKALQFADEAATLEEVFRASFCLDYLYFCKPVPSGASERTQTDEWLRHLGSILWCLCFTRIGSPIEKPLLYCLLQRRLEGLQRLQSVQHQESVRFGAGEL
jgi:hypothetical protein